MHSWVFRNRRRLEAIYGMRARPQREPVLRPLGTRPADETSPPRLRVHALVPCRRRRA